MRRAAALIVAVVLGASCTGDRPVTTPTGPEEETSSPTAKPTCEASPGAPPAGFVLVRSREFRYEDHIGVREDYRAEDGRLLVYLLGVMGEMGEGANVVEDVKLRGGQKATLFGTGGRRGWSVVWEDALPCPQMAVVGNGFSRSEFEAALLEIGLLAQHRPAGAADGYSEWIAVFDVARRFEELDPSTEELLETAGMDHIAVGQASCWKGLPRKLGVGLNAVVAAVYGPGEAQLDEVIEAVGREPIFRGELVAYCID